MQDKDKILIIDKTPFGKLTDSFKWCEYLRKDYDITFICLSPKNQSEILCMDGVHVKHITSAGPYWVRGLRYMLACLYAVLRFHGVILIVYFEHCGVFKKCFPWKKIWIDIRTLAVCGTKEEKDSYDNKIRQVCSKSDYVTTVSEGVANYLKLTNPTVSVLPLGSDIISQAKKDYSKLRLLYVGTLSGRNIDITIDGVAKFLTKFPAAEIEYKIIGSGFGNELELMKSKVHALGLEKCIHFLGLIPHHQLASHFNSSNIGVSFVPITEAYNRQPVTKTFEYANSGLFVIGTATDENIKVISPDNGILIQDTIDGFFDGLCQVYERKSLIREERVRSSLKTYTWKNIIDNYFRPVLNQLK